MPVGHDYRQQTMDCCAYKFAKEIGCTACALALCMCASLPFQAVAPEYQCKTRTILLLLRFPLFLYLFLCACALSFTHCAVFLLPFFFIHCNNSSVCLCTTCARRICSLLLVRYPHLGNTIAIGRCRTASQGHCHSGWGKAIVRSKLILDRLRPCLFLRDRHRSLLRHTFDHHRNDPQHPTQVHNHRNANI